VHRNYTLQPKHKIFLGHSGAQKGFVEQLCLDLERCDRHPFFDKRRDSLPIGKDFPSLIFQAIEQCEVGVVVLSEEFFSASKWPMLELVAMKNVKKRNPSFTIIPILLGITLPECLNRENQNRWLSTWHVWAKCDSRIDIEDWENALQLFRRTNALKYNPELGEVKFREEIVEEICKMVPSETRLEDSYILGRSRSCKVCIKTIFEIGSCM
jgi:hypothetical protein